MLDALSARRWGAVAGESRRRLGWTLLAIAAVWMIAAAHWAATDTVVPWDSKNQFYAFFRFLASALHSGHSPFWNPYHYGGHPSVADPQSLVFAPAFMLWAYIDPTPSFRTFDLIVYAHLLVGGLAIGGIGWRTGWPIPATLLAAFVFMFGGPASGRLQHTGIIMSYGLFPLALLLAQVALQRCSLAAAAGFGVVAALLALGRNQEALLLCYLLAAIIGAHIVSAPGIGRYLRKRAAVLATMSGVGVALLAVPLLLTLQFASLSNRPAIALDTALEASLYPANLASLAVANVLGSLSGTADYWGPNFDTLPEVGATDRSFNYLFIGLAATIVILWFGVGAGWLLRRGTRLLTAALAVALLFALGRYTPLYTLAFEHIPGIGLFRRPIDGTFLLVAVMALLAGQLLADYVRKGVPDVDVSRLVAVAGAGLGIIVWAVVFSGRSGRMWSSALEVAKSIPVAVTVIVLLARAKTAEGRRLAAACVAAIGAAELLWCNTASSLNAEPPGYYAVLQRPAGEEAKALGVLERELDARHREGERPRVEVVGVSGPWQNLAMARGIEATNGYNPLRIGSYDRLVSPGETTHLVDQRQFPASFDGYDCALARELGLEYVVLGRPIEEVPHLARRPVSEVLLAGPKVWIYRLRGAERRVKLITRVQIADTDAQVLAGQFRLMPGGDTAVIDNDTKPSRSYWPAVARQGQNRAQILAWSPDRIEIETDSAQSGILVLHETYYPGWVAEIDGRPTPILRANVLFRGVEVGEGHHVIVFRFAPFALENLRDALASALHGTH